jgi:hypothetical protein
VIANTNDKFEEITLAMCGMRVGPDITIIQCMLQRCGDTSEAARRPYLTVNRTAQPSPGGGGDWMRLSWVGGQLLDSE